MFGKFGKGTEELSGIVEIMFLYILIESLFQYISA